MNTKLMLCASLALAAASAQTNLTTTAIQRYFNNIRRNLEGAADAMPADKYSYRLTAGQNVFRRVDQSFHRAQLHRLCDAPLRDAARIG